MGAAMRPAESEEIEGWDALVAAQGTAASVLQGQAFTEIKRTGGWAPTYWMTSSRPVLVLKRLVPGLGWLNYVPGGPACESLDELSILIDELKTKLPGFLLQVEPELVAGEADGFAKSHGWATRPPIQPNHSTVLVNLGSDEDDLIAAFHQKTRYNIRLAERKGVLAEPAELTPENMQLMYGLMRSSQERGGYFMRSYEYFETAWQTYVKNKNGQLFFAKYEDKVLAGAFVTYLGQKALYKDGGSIREHREVQPMYALQWAAMRWLKNHGVIIYDLHGVPPEDRLDDPTHPFAGLARFKTGFQPSVTTFVGVIEVPLEAPAYRIWKVAGERLYGAALYRLRGQTIY
jgi:serine/alanine adding enzyme